MAEGKMPPPGGGLMIAIGLGKKKPGMDRSAMQNDRESDEQDAPDHEEGEYKSSEGEAIVLRAGEKVCGQCANYDPIDGSCQQVNGSFDPNDRCLRYFEPHEHDEREEHKSGEEEQYGQMAPRPSGRMQGPPEA